MSVIAHERIWAFQNDTLLPREGTLILDEQPLHHSGDLAGPLYVEQGLRPIDVIVFIGYCGLLEEPDTTYDVGYMVTQVEQDGSGILVGGDMMAAEPKTWMNERVAALWRLLHRADIYLADFGLEALDTYVEAA